MTPNVRRPLTEERPVVHRYNQLPEIARKLIEDEQKMARLDRAIDFIEWLDTTRRYVKWTVVTILALFFTGFALTDYITRALAWWRGP